MYVPHPCKKPCLIFLSLRNNSPCCFHVSFSNSLHRQRNPKHVAPPFVNLVSVFVTYLGWVKQNCDPLIRKNLQEPYLHTWVCVVVLLSTPWLVNICRMNKTFYFVIKGLHLSPNLDLIDFLPYHQLQICVQSFQFHQESLRLRNAFV